MSSSAYPNPQEVLFSSLLRNFLKALVDPPVDLFER